MHAQPTDTDPSQDPSIQVPVWAIKQLALVPTMMSVFLESDDAVEMKKLIDQGARINYKTKDQSLILRALKRQKTKVLDLLMTEDKSKWLSDEKVWHFLLKSEDKNRITQLLEDVSLKATITLMEHYKGWHSEKLAPWALDQLFMKHHPRKIFSSAFRSRQDFDGKMASHHNTVKQVIVYGITSNKEMAKKYLKDFEPLIKKWGDFSSRFSSSVETVALDPPEEFKPIITKHSSQISSNWARWNKLTRLSVNRILNKNTETK